MERQGRETGPEFTETEAVDEDEERAKPSHLAHKPEQTDILQVTDLALSVSACAHLGRQMTGWM